MATYNNISSIKIGNDTFNLKIGETSTDTKNTAGATNTSSKIYLIGATVQDANPQTYSHDTVYIGSNGHLYSNEKQVVNLSDSQNLTNKTYNGLSLTNSTSSFSIQGGSSTAKTLTVNKSYTLGDACAKAVDTSISSGSTSENLPTSAAVANFVEGKGYITSDDVTTGVTDVKAPYSSTTAVTKVNNGVATLNVASTSYYGLTKLSDSYTSTSTTLAATPNAVKQAYDLANTANSTANDASSIASTASSNANTALTKANSAYDKGIEFVASGTYSSGTIGGRISDSSLTSGKIYVVKMGAATTATNHSVRFQNSSGTNLSSYPLYAYGSTRSNQAYPSGTVLMFVYYSSAFYLINSFALTT